MPSAPFVSQGHAAGRYTAQVRVLPAASATKYQSLVFSTKLPIGALIGQFHTLRASESPGPVYLMKRQEDGWRFGLVRADGNLDAELEPALCQRCHADARSDSRFGLPLSELPDSDAGN